MSNEKKLYAPDEPTIGDHIFSSATSETIFNANTNDPNTATSHTKPPFTQHIQQQRYPNISSQQQQQQYYHHQRQQPPPLQQQHSGLNNPYQLPSQQIPQNNQQPHHHSPISWNPQFQQYNHTSPSLNKELNYYSSQQPPVQQNSPYGSPTYQFKNPWYSQNSPVATAPNLSTSNTSNYLQTQTRQFNNPLETTYEYDDSAIQPPQHQQRQRKHSLVLPPSRAPAPQPYQQQSIYNDNSVQLNNEFQRRQSVATVHQTQPGSNQPLVQLQSPLLNYPRRKSFYQYPVNLKSLPVPKVRKTVDKSELKPTINKTPKYRRASMGSNYISPLNSLTTELTTTFSLCNPNFHYEVSKNPKRMLTKPSEGKLNNGYDNEDNDYILYVNDVLGVEENKKYLVLDILGHGTFAQVVKCQNLKTKELVAVKVVKSKNSYINQSLSEISLLELINKKIDPLDQHHFLRMKDKFIHKSHLCIVFELLSSNLFELIKQNQFKGLNLKLVRNFTRQLLDSLCVLKDSKIIHCDLKPENILLVSSDKPDIKIVDFGSACQERQTLYTYIQSRFYRSPEVLLGLPYTSSIDTWSLGCIIAELFLGLPLFPGNSEYDQLNKIIKIMGMPPNWMIEMGKSAKIFLEKDFETNEYKLKSLGQYNKERELNEDPGKVYFNTNDLNELILKYTMNRKAMTTTMIEKELSDRKCLIHLIKGLLNLNPLERWTPQQAILHPFITEQKFNDDWAPPGASNSKLKKLVK
ncbi:hypothetical protein WICMUC_002439 [Wickerhamomyces mucosus]|uniref:Protein kinase domain-containing protein n=1 Tax=Wickerhamomyces mucosus TaxID=1378264 RepID=A0A9P8PR94_9ASCO|nr:hypothetical protein WICMUC_002439 [Wickerhamomyces mucosus]